MTISLELKQKLHQHLMGILNEKIEAIMASILETSESMKNDTKSSAGDKFETGREMMQIEINNKQVQLNKLKHLMLDLQKVDLKTINKSIGFGSLIVSNMGNYFMAIAQGKVTLDQNEYYALSLASPIGQALKGKKSGDQIDFQGKKIDIKAIT